MPDRPQIQKQKKKKTAPKKQQPELLGETHSKEKQKKLKELDEFIEGVLQEAGEDFVDRFKQVEGE